MGSVQSMKKGETFLIGLTDLPIAVSLKLSVVWYSGHGLNKELLVCKSGHDLNNKLLVCYSNGDLNMDHSTFG